MWMRTGKLSTSASPRFSSTFPDWSRASWCEKLEITKKTHLEQGGRGYDEWECHTGKEAALIDAARKEWSSKQKLLCPLFLQYTFFFIPSLLRPSCGPLWQGNSLALRCMWKHAAQEEFRGSWSLDFLKNFQEGMVGKKGIRLKLSFSFSALFVLVLFIIKIFRTVLWCNLLKKQGNLRNLCSYNDCS